MSALDIHFSLKGNVDSLYATRNKRKDFYIIIQNLTDNYIPQVNSKNRVFKILSKQNGNFTLTATLTTKSGHNIELPIKLQVGAVQEGTKPIIAKPEAEKTIVKVNCPFCGEKIDEDAKFCPHCGSKLTEVKEEAVENQEEKPTKHCLNCGIKD